MIFCGIEREKCPYEGKKSGVFLVTIAALAVSGGVCFASDDGDFQFWSNAGVSIDLSKNWAATFEEEFRFGDNARYLYYHHSELGFAYKGLADWLSVGFNYRQIFEEDSSGEWWYENRPHLNATLSASFLGLMSATGRG